MLESSLHDPYDPRWRDEPAFNLEVARSLSQAYAFLKSATTRPDAYLRAHACASRCLPLPMAARQRMLVFFALASACIGGAAFVSGLDCLEVALDLAEDLEDLPAQVELAYLAGAAARARSLYTRVANYLEFGLATLRALGEDDRPADRALELNTLIGLMMSDYSLEQYDMALERLTEARALAGSPEFRLQRAAFDWITALVMRTRDEPEHALHMAVAAAEVYARDPSPTAVFSFGRLQAVVADLALDLAELSSPDAPHRTRNAFVAMAEPYALRAVQLAHDAQDTAGEGIALLARARLERIAGHWTSRKATIESVIRLADQKEDVPLLAQAYTAMGEEQAASGNPEQALNCYRKTLDVVGPSEVPAMALRAKRALVRASATRL